MNATLILILLSTTTPHPHQRVLRLPAPDLAACAADGDRVALGWLTRHPGWRLVGWRCDQKAGR